MDKDKKRAERRAENERLKRQRCRYWGYAWMVEEMSERFLGMVLATPKPCNCWMCSKPRKHTMSIQEIREFQPKLHEFDLDSKE